MILKKMVGIILCALLSPIAFRIIWLPNVMEAILYEKYEYNDFHITTLRRFLEVVYDLSYIEVVFSLFFIFSPFQLIKDAYNKIGYNLSFVEKIGLLCGILTFWILIYGMVANIWTTPWYKNFLYIAFAGGIWLIFRYNLTFYGRQVSGKEGIKN